MKKKINNGIFYVVISLVAVLGVAGFVVAYSGYGTPKNVIEGDYIEAAQVSVQSDSLGAVSGPDRYYPIFSDNAIGYAPVGSVAMQTATTTLCSIKNPFGGATSTLVFFDYQITTGTSTAATLVINASTGAYASSTATNIGSANTVASGAQDSWSWSQNTASMDIGEVSPNEYILLQTEGVGLSGYTYTGKCQAEFRLMP